MSTGAGIRYSTIIEAGPDNPHNSTASVIELTAGRLLVVWNKGAAGELSGSDFGPNRIFFRESADGGLTWQNERLVVDIQPGDLNVQAPALCRLPAGDILLICLRAHARNCSTMVVFRSTDEAATFTEISRVWERSSGQWLQGGASSLVLLSSGRLLLPFHGGDGEQGRQHNVAHCAISDDNGQSWRLSPGLIDLPMRGAMEASVAELPGGRLVMSLRTQLGAVFISTSDDQGENWSLAQTSGLRSPESCTCLRLLPGTSDLVLFWNDSLYNPRVHHYGVRTPLSAARSSDGGQTWRRLGEIDRGAFEFTNIGCTFVRHDMAIVTYMQSPDPGDGRPFQRDKIDLLAAVIERSWFER